MDPRPFPPTVRQVMTQVRGLLTNDQFVLVVLAVLMGLIVGAAVVGFRMMIDAVHLLFFNATDDTLASTAANMPWWQVWMAPVLGGAAVGLLYHLFMPGGRPQSISHVIEAAALRNGRMSPRAGIVSALGAAMSIGSGASVGREGPAVHLGSALCSWCAEKLHLGPALSRTMLGCGAAAAVAASFNAPIAGALFAHEVVVGHYAMSALAPVVVASVTATLVSRGVFGHFPAFELPDMHLASVLEFPAFAGLGLLSGLIAIVFMRSLFLGEKLSQKTPVPTALKPVIGGVIMGAIAVPLPHVLSVGYEITDLVLKDSVPLLMIGVLILAKIVATSIVLGFGFGGGVFSPSLTIGALVGAFYGVLATQALPELSSGSGAYALIGMGAMAAAVLGAPVSTVLIIFEMTHDTVLTVAVMMAVVIATTICQAVLKVPSYFYWQLERRGLDLRGGHQLRLLRTMQVKDVIRTDCPMIPQNATYDEVRHDLALVPYGELFVKDENHCLVGTIMLSDLIDHADEPDATAASIARRQPPVLTCTDTLENALKTMMSLGEEHMAVVEDRKTMKLIGCVGQAELLLEYNRKVLTSQEDQGPQAPLPF